MKTIEEIKAETPFLPVTARLTESSYSQHLRSAGLTPPPSQWSREQLEGYNRWVNEYYSDWVLYRESVQEWHLLLQRTFDVFLAVYNDGNLPATDIDVDLTFPGHIRLYEADIEPPKPKAPKAPPLRPMGPGDAFATPIEPEIIPIVMPEYMTRIVDLDQERNIARIHIPKLKHNTYLEIPKFKISFEDEKGVETFLVYYSISDNVSLEATSGMLHFDIVTSA